MVQPLRLAAAAALLQACSLAAEDTCRAAGGKGCGVRSHLWPHARGQPGHGGSRYSVTNLTGPSDASKPWYSWFPGKTRFRSVTLCGPLIDDQKNLYVTSIHAITKLTTEGQIIWEFRPPCGTGISDCPSLSEGSQIFGTCASGHAYAVDIDTGGLQWIVQHGLGSGDTAYVENHDGLVLYEMDPTNLRIMAVKASDGSKVWEYYPDAPMWNLMAVFPGDDTVLFQDMDARVYRLGLHNGSLIWKNGGGHQLGKTWSDGGAMIGPNGLVYAASSKSQVATHHPTAGGGVHAYRIDNGELVWQHHLRRPFFSWPAVGKLAGRDGYSVIVSLGANAYFPWKQIWNHAVEATLASSFGVSVMVVLLLVQLRHCRCSAGGCKWLTLRFLCLLLLLLPVPIYATYMYCQGRSGFPVKTFEAEVIAYDADTGEQQWIYYLPSWPYVSAAGDSEGYNERGAYVPERQVCLPAAYSAPTIDARGTVWLGYHSGMVLGLRDENGDGLVTEDEVLSFDTQGAFLHSGPAFAPGIMAITNCDTMWTWKI